MTPAPNPETVPRNTTVNVPSNVQLPDVPCISATTRMSKRLPKPRSRNPSRVARMRLGRNSMNTSRDQTVRKAVLSGFGDMNPKAASAPSSVRQQSLAHRGIIEASPRWAQSLHVQQRLFRPECRIHPVLGALNEERLPAARERGERDVGYTVMQICLNSGRSAIDDRASVAQSNRSPLTHQRQKGIRVRVKNVATEYDAWPCTVT